MPLHNHLSCSMSSPNILMNLKNLLLSKKEISSLGGRTAVRPYKRIQESSDIVIPVVAAAFPRASEPQFPGEASIASPDVSPGIATSGVILASLASTDAPQCNASHRRWHHFPTKSASPPAEASPASPDVSPGITSYFPVTGSSLFSRERSEPLANALY